MVISPVNIKDTIASNIINRLNANSERFLTLQYVISIISQIINANIRIDASIIMLPSHLKSITDLILRVCLS